MKGKKLDLSAVLQKKSVLLLLLAGGLLLLLLRLFRKGKYSGRLVACYLLVYAPLRFGLEFLRGDAARGVVFRLSASQWLSVLLFCTALWINR